MPSRPRVASSTAAPDGGQAAPADPARRRRPPFQIPDQHVIDDSHTQVTDALHRLLVASVVDYAIYGLTSDGRVATWNAGAERLKGYAPDEILGRPVSEFYPPEARGADGVAARSRQLLETAERDGRAEDEGWRVRRDGTRFWANVVVTPVRDEGGTLVGFAKVTRDLTARLAAEEQARALAAEQAALAESQRAEAELRELNARLREQAAELEAQTEEAQSLAEELEQANEMLQQSADETDAARARAESLQRVTAALAGARSLADVGRLFSRQLTALLGSDTAWVGVVSDDGDALEAVGWAGYPEEAAVHWRRLPMDANVAVVDVVRSGTPQWWTTHDALVAAYPARAGVIRTAAQESVAVLPMLGAEHDPAAGGAGVIGGIAVGFRARREFDADTRAFFVALAQQCAQAVSRARAFESERVARADADTARRHAEVLQAITAQLYEAERRARAEAEAANQAKGQFLATMSHELRTPLNAIAGHAELIELGIHGPVSEEQLSALARIQRSQKHLLSLINEVLNHARLEAGMVQYQMQDVAVSAVLTGVESVMQPQVRAKGLRLSVDRSQPRLAVRADAEKLGQVLLNLLSNAVKFTEPGGEIRVDCEVTEATAAGGGQVLITVTDTGVGVPPDQAERIFEPFVQVGRSLSTPGEGTGLGLAISRDLARGMGGDLTLRSTPVRGSTFAVTLLRAPEHAR